jgi:hypothetical protein
MLTLCVTSIMPLVEGRTASLICVILPCQSFLKHARNSWSSHASMTFLRSLAALWCALNALCASFGTSSNVAMMMFYGWISELIVRKDRFDY